VEKSDLPIRTMATEFLAGRNLKFSCRCKSPYHLNSMRLTQTLRHMFRVISTKFLHLNGKLRKLRAKEKHLLISLYNVQIVQYKQIYVLVNMKLAVERNYNLAKLIAQFQAFKITWLNLQFVLWKIGPLN
jgi:hypothetical protein